MTIKDKTDGGGSILLWLEFGGTKGRLQARLLARQNLLFVYVYRVTCRI